MIILFADSYILTTRDFSYTFGVSAYAIERAPALAGHANTRWMRFSIAGDNYGDPSVTEVPRYLYANNLLPPDIDGNKLPP